MGVMMTCGCAAQGTCSRKGGVVYDPPIPVCITHDCLEPADSAPVLTGRKARCVYFGPISFRSFESNYVKLTGCSRQRCTCELPSDPGLPFFIYQGAGTPSATKCRHCGYFKSAHEKSGHRCRGYEASGDTGFDRFYCGCAGWD